MFRIVRHGFGLNKQRAITKSSLWVPRHPHRLIAALFYVVFTGTGMSAARAQWTVTCEASTNAITITGTSGPPTYKNYSGTNPISGSATSGGSGGGGGGGGATDAFLRQRGGSRVRPHTIPVAGSGSSAHIDGAGGGGPVNPIGNGTVTCDGTITAHVKWTGSADSVPPAIVVEEDSTVDGNVTATTGLPSNLTGAQNQIVVPSNDTATHKSDSSYTVVQSPAASFDITVKPIAKSDSAATTDNTIGVTASVTYKVTINSVDVTLNGGIGTPNAKRYLIGQQLVGKLMHDNLPTPTYTWAVDGGRPFNNFVASDDTGTYYPFHPRASDDLSCYFAYPSTPTVTCTAHFDVSSGAQPTLDVTVVKNKVSVEAPTVDVKPHIGTVVDDTSSSPQWERLWTMQADGTYKPPGMTWNVTVVTPPDFVTPPNNDYGQWNWTQLVAHSYQRKNNGVVEQIVATNYNPPVNIFGIFCLDNKYPIYGFYYPANGNPDPATGMLRGDGANDSPGVSLETDANVTSKDVLGQFHSYVMYIPPGPSVAVPLKEVDWSWKFHAEQSGGVWTVTGKDAPQPTLSDYPSLFPQWTILSLNNKHGYAPP